jgi:hypothetical protein
VRISKTPLRNISFDGPLREIIGIGAGIVQEPDQRLELASLQRWQGEQVPVNVRGERLVSWIIPSARESRQTKEFCRDAGINGVICTTGAAPPVARSEHLFSRRV